MEPQILFKDAYVENGDVYVPALIAEGEFWNANGICYASSLLQEVHDKKLILDLAHNAHPTGNHPLAYEPEPPDDLAESAKVEYYKKKSHDWGFGKYVKTFIKTLDSGSKRLYGIFKITDKGAAKAWNEKKFPPFVSSSSFVHEKNEKGIITKASFVGVSSVKNPAYPPHIAGADKKCIGGLECISKLAESSSKRDHYCMYCRYTTLTNLSSHSNDKLSESSMENDSSNPPADSEKKPEGTVDSPVTNLGETHTDAHGEHTEEREGEKTEVDYKALAEKLLKENKDLTKQLKTEKETNATNTKDILAIKKESLASKIREKLAKVPLFAFDNKEENKEEVVKEFLEFYPTLKEEKILSLVEKRFMLAPMVMKANEQQKGLKESGMITKDGKLVIHDEKDNINGYSIGDCTGVFG